MTKAKYIKKVSELTKFIKLLEKEGYCTKLDKEIGLVKLKNLGNGQAFLMKTSINFEFRLDNYK